MLQVARVGFSGFLQVPKRGFVSSDILPPICETVLQKDVTFCAVHSSSCVTNVPQPVLPTYQHRICIVLRNKNVLGAGKALMTF